MAHNEVMAIYEPILPADYEPIGKHELAQATQPLPSPCFEGLVLSVYDGMQETTLTREQIKAWLSQRLSY